MVNAGEESGNLPESLHIIGEQLTKSYELRRKIKGAMIYPAIVITLIIAIAILMMIFLVPTLSETFRELGGELPLSTQVIIWVSDFLVRYVFFVLIALAATGMLCASFFKTPIGKRYLSFALLKLPVISSITKQANAALTMRTLSSLISSGVSMVQALEITKKVLQNPFYTNVLERAEKEVQKGLPLSSVFQAEGKLYPVLVGEMIEVGEETGKLSEMLLKGAVFYEGEVDSITKNLSTVIEPALMIIIGIAVGFFAVAMIKPIYSLGDLI